MRFVYEFVMRHYEVCCVVVAGEGFFYDNYLHWRFLSAPNYERHNALVISL